MKNNLFITYSLIKTLYEKNRDYIDTFCTFTLKIIKDHEEFDLCKLQQLIMDEYKILIPENTLKTLLIRAHKRNLIDRNNKLTEEGFKHIEKIENVREVDRKINELINDIKEYLDDKGLSENQIYEILLGFINKNISSIVEFCSPVNKKSSKIFIKKKTTKYDQRLIEYLHTCNERKPQIWKTLESLIFGSILSVSPCVIDVNIAKKKFKNISIFMDSNFIFSLLDLHRPEFCRPTKELFNLIKNFNFKLKIFDFTLDEIIGVLNKAITERKKYIEGIEVNSIFSVIVDKGWSDIDIMNKIRDIRRELNEKDIQIEFSNINLKNYKPDKKYITILEKYKDISISYKINHDVAVIEQIKKIRVKDQIKIEDTVAFFLTSDLKLSKANYEEMSHKENGTIAEIIPDILLTNILWLKNPLAFKNIPICAVIAANSNDLFIDKRVWERFYYNLVKLKKEGRITDLDITILFYDDYFKNKLLELNEIDIDKNNEELIINELDAAKGRSNNNSKKEMESQQKIYDLEISAKDKKISELIEAREKSKSKVAEESNHIALILTRVTYIITGIIIVIIVISVYYFSKVFNFQNGLIFIAAILGLLPLLGFKFNIFDLKEKLLKKISGCLYEKKIRQYSLKNY